MTALADEPPESTSRRSGGASAGRIAATRERIESSCDSRIARGCAAAGIEPSGIAVAAAGEDEGEGDSLSIFSESSSRHNRSSDSDLDDDESAAHPPDHYLIHTDLVNQSAVVEVDYKDTTTAQLDGVEATGTE